ncbi:MAG: hypothetical protein LLG06_00905 [Desulfobacteraceae bacterium]|nr:hypothetical protein [Desulfobacteraceae bacterium]
MSFRKSKNRVIRLTLMLAFLVFVPQAFSTTDDCADAPTWTTGNWTKRDCITFERSLVETAKPATASKMSNALLAVVPPYCYDGTTAWPNDSTNTQRLQGGSISWEGAPGQSRVRVAAFMDRAGYEKFYRKYMLGYDAQGNAVAPESRSILTKSLWVTVVPELRNYFYGKSSAYCPPSRERMVQLLGLNPRNSYDVIVEMYVNPQDLFRPTPDPEITDHQGLPAAKLQETEEVDGQTVYKWAFPSPFTGYAENDLLYLDFPYSSDPWLRSPRTYRQWFAYNAEHTYANADSPWKTAPWTRLGYTYDWGNANNPVGASEFMIRVHPDLEGNGPGVYVTYIRAVKAYDKSWSEYYRCRGRRDRITLDNVPDADKNVCLSSQPPSTCVAR